jgi:hypothetical protein
MLRGKASTSSTGSSPKQAAGTRIQARLQLNIFVVDDGKELDRNVDVDVDYNTGIGKVNCTG